MPKSRGRKTPARDAVTRLEQLRNVGPALAADLRRVGVRVPHDLPGQDPYALYEALCADTGERHDPCVLDVFISAVRFMEGAPARPWWHYTAERKRLAFHQLLRRWRSGLKLSGDVSPDVPPRPAG